MLEQLQQYSLSLLNSFVLDSLQSKRVSKYELDKK